MSRLSRFPYNLSERPAETQIRNQREMLNYANQSQSSINRGIRAEQDREWKEVRDSMERRLRWERLLQDGKEIGVGDIDWRSTDADLEWLKERKRDLEAGIRNHGRFGHNVNYSRTDRVLGRKWLREMELGIKLWDEYKASGYNDYMKERRARELSALSDGEYQHDMDVMEELGLIEEYERNKGIYDDKMRDALWRDRKRRNKYYEGLKQLRGY